MPSSPRIAAAATAVAAVLALVTAPQAAAAKPLPPVEPTPQSITRVSPDVPVTGQVVVVADQHTDQAALAELTSLLHGHGASKVTTVAPGDETSLGHALVVRIGGADRADITGDLGDLTV